MTANQPRQVPIPTVHRALEIMNASKKMAHERSAIKTTLKRKFPINK